MYVYIYICVYVCILYIYAHVAYISEYTEINAVAYLAIQPAPEREPSINQGCVQVQVNAFDIPSPPVTQNTAASSMLSRTGAFLGIAFSQHPICSVESFPYALHDK